MNSNSNNNNNKNNNNMKVLKTKYTNPTGFRRCYGKEELVVSFVEGPSENVQAFLDSDLNALSFNKHHEKYLASRIDAKIKAQRLVEKLVDREVDNMDKSVKADAVKEEVKVKSTVSTVKAAPTTKVVVERVIPAAPVAAPIKTVITPVAPTTAVNMTKTTVKPTPTRPTAASSVTSSTPTEKLNATTAKTRVESLSQLEQLKLDEKQTKVQREAANANENQRVYSALKKSNCFHDDVNTFLFFFNDAMDRIVALQPSLQRAIEKIAKTSSKVMSVILKMDSFQPEFVMDALEALSEIHAFSLQLDESPFAERTDLKALRAASKTLLEVYGPWFVKWHTEISKQSL